jgi:hypothetical protein
MPNCRLAWSRRCLRCLQLSPAHVVTSQRNKALVTGQRPVRVSVHRGALARCWSRRPGRRGFNVACTRSLRLVCRSGRDGALSRPADISVSTQRHGCHPVRGCPVTHRLGWDQLHVCSHYGRPHRPILQTWPHHWLLCSRPCANDAAVSG